MKRTITVFGEGASTSAIAADRNNNYASFNDCIGKTRNTSVDNAKDLDIVMSIYTLIEYSDNYEKTTESLWQYCRDEPDDNDITGSELSKFK